MSWSGASSEGQGIRVAFERVKVIVTSKIAAGGIGIWLTSKSKKRKEAEIEKNSYPERVFHRFHR